MRSSELALPIHDELGPVTRAIEVVSLLLAAGLLLLHVYRFALLPPFIAWWVPFAVLTGIVLADFTSGIVHWAADTWGSETMPVLGRRFLRPFRVHHVNPDDFLKRNFIDTNGDVAMICSVWLLAAFLIPLETGAGQVAAVVLVAFSAGGLPTNQVHQWAHMRRPPPWVQWLQRRGVLLSRAQHQIHHTAPYATHYCIATGWCNPLLASVGFFPALERIVSRLTGLLPREDDQAFTTESEARISAQKSPASGGLP